jgi:hypothetical protein
VENINIGGGDGGNCRSNSQGYFDRGRSRRTDGCNETHGEQKSEIDSTDEKLLPAFASNLQHDVEARDAALSLIKMLPHSVELEKVLKCMHCMIEIHIVLQGHQARVGAHVLHLNSQAYSNIMYGLRVLQSVPVVNHQPQWRDEIKNSLEQLGVAAGRWHHNNNAEISDRLVAPLSPPLYSSSSSAAPPSN